MMTDNKTRREIKLAYEERRNAITYDCNSRLDRINVEMERLRTDINYHAYLLRQGDVSCRERLNELNDQMATLHRAKTKLDFERRQALNQLKREYYERMNEHELQQEQRKEVAV